MKLDERIYVGLEFKHYARGHVYEVVDIHTTSNIAGEVVRIVIVCQRNFLGQILTSHCPQSTIIRSIDTTVN